jgi:hypothetical protein
MREEDRRSNLAGRSSQNINMEINEDEEEDEEIEEELLDDDISDDGSYGLEDNEHD